MTTGAFQRQFAAMAAAYRATLPAHLGELSSMWHAVREGGSSEGLDTLRRALHALAGAAGTFGLPAVTESARAAESFLDPYCQSGATLTPGDHAVFEGLLEAVRKSALASAK
jgi:HPt (histidine-containing phosphotransfer) domain-containing protein